ncbi:piggyBac transposable element-derived protein 4-like [Littorina saxatilis]|uniref:piggyBac transposable element-derived protein 4-like n=1 Tax=Littorina saxatilis TaxID=31220 RepID=UPI0038B5B18B
MTELDIKTTSSAKSSKNISVAPVQVMEAVDVVEAAGSLDDPPSGEDETTDEEGPLPPLDDSSPEQSEDEPEEDEPSSQTAKDGTLWQNKIISDVVKCTNIEGRRVKKDAWVPTNDEEIEAVIGMLLFLGTKKHNMLSTEEIWDSSYGHPIIRACMGRRRFQTLMTHMRFDDKSTRNARRERDVFAPFRDVWDKFQKSLKSHYIPGPLLTVDEQLVPFRGRCSFLQYLPSKPDRYGMKVFWIADAEQNFPLYGVPYLGRPAGQERQVNLGRNIAVELATPFFKSGRNVTCDNFFTDLTLSEKLLKNGMTLVGTVRANKRFLPDSLKTKKHLALNDKDLA